MTVKMYKSEFSLCHMNRVRAKEVFITYSSYHNISIILCNLIIHRTNLSGVVAAENITLNNAVIVEAYRDLCLVIYV